MTKIKLKHTLLSIGAMIPITAVTSLAISCGTNDSNNSSAAPHQTKPVIAKPTKPIPTKLLVRTKLFYGIYDSTHAGGPKNSLNTNGLDSYITDITLNNMTPNFGKKLGITIDSKHMKTSFIDPDKDYRDSLVDIGFYLQDHLYFHNFNGDTNNELYIFTGTLDDGIKFIWLPKLQQEKDPRVIFLTYSVLRPKINHGIQDGGSVDSIPKDVYEDGAHYGFSRLKVENVKGV